MEEKSLWIGEEGLELLVGEEDPVEVSGEAEEGLDVGDVAILVVTRGLGAAHQQNHGAESEVVQFVDVAVHVLDFLFALQTQSVGEHQQFLQTSVCFVAAALVYAGPDDFIETHGLGGQVTVFDLFLVELGHELHDYLVEGHHVVRSEFEEVPDREWVVVAHLRVWVGDLAEHVDRHQ